MYSLSDDDQATIIYKLADVRNDTLYLDMYLNHVSYINNLKAYAKKFICRKCNRYFDRSANCQRHELTCNDEARLKYPCGFYTPNKTIFDKLSSIGRDVTLVYRFHNDFAVYDFECMIACWIANSCTSILQSHTSIHICMLYSVRFPGHICHPSPHRTFPILINEYIIYLYITINATLS